MVTFACVYKVGFVSSVLSVAILQVSHPGAFRVFSKFPHADNGIIFEESGNGLHMGLVGYGAGFDGGAGNPLLTVTCPLHPFNSSMPSGRREKGRQKEAESSQLVSARTHQFQVMFRQRTCHGASTSCQHGEQRSSFDRSHVYIPNPLQQENLFPSNELPPPSAGSPSCRNASTAGESFSLEPWNSRVSARHIYL